MSGLLRRLDRWRILALVLWIVPVLALLPLGLLWLREIHALSYWLATLALFSAGGYALQWWLRRRERVWLEDAQTEADSDWPAAADAAWSLVEQMAREVRPEDWPIGEGVGLEVLGQRTLERVARHFHPEVAEPLLELTLPHGLLIIERASRDLRETITEHIPLSHRLTVGSLARAYRWKPLADRLLGLYRAGQWVMNPANALLNEAWTHLRGRGYALARDELYSWLLQEYVRNVGRYAIELYSGRLLLSDEVATERVTPRSTRDLEAAQANVASVDAEPLRILVLGPGNAGKSSLINALFGRLRVATDTLPATTGIMTPLLLAHKDLDLALIFDAPGLEALSPRILLEAAADADLLLWVSAANRADRDSEREALDALRAAVTERLDRRPPPLLLVVTHIDRLRPIRDWSPPYDLNDQSDPKAVNIRDAMAAVADDLAVPLADTIPVCLAQGRVYNVDDSLWALILERLDAVQRARLLRCEAVRRGEEHWRLLRRQLAATGRFLIGLPARRNRH